MNSDSDLLAPVAPLTSGSPRSPLIVPSVLEDSQVLTDSTSSVTKAQAPENLAESEKARWVSEDVAEPSQHLTESMRTTISQTLTESVRSLGLPENAEMDVRIILKRIRKLEEGIPKDLELPKDLDNRLQSLEVQSREFFTMIQSSKQRIEGERSERWTDVASLKRMIESLSDQQNALRNDFQVSESRRLAEGDKLQAGLSTLEAVVRAEACIGGVKERKPSGSPSGSAEVSLDTSFDWHEFLGPEVQLAVDGAEARLKQAIEERCTKIERAIQADLGDMQSNLQVIAEQLNRSRLQQYAGNADHSIHEDRAEGAEAELRKAILAQLGSAQGIEHKGQAQEHLERRLKAVESAAGRWLQSIGGTVESAAQQLSTIESQLINILSAGGKDSESASCLFSLFQYLIALFQCLETERINCQTQLQNASTPPTSVRREPPSSLPLPSALLLPPSATGSASNEKVVVATFPGSSHEIPVGAGEAFPTDSQTPEYLITPDSTTRSTTRSEQAVWNSRMQTLVSRLDALLEENAQLCEANHQMSEQLTVLGGKPSVPALTSSATAVPKININIEPNITARTQSSSGLRDSQRSTTRSVEVMTQSSVRDSQRVDIATMQQPRSVSPGPFHTTQQPRSVSPVQRQPQATQLQPGTVQPLQQQQQSQFANPAAVRLQSPVQSQRCVSPTPKSLVQPAFGPASFSTQRQSMPRMVSAPAQGMSTQTPFFNRFSLGRAMGPQSPIQGSRECR